MYSLLIIDDVQLSSSKLKEWLLRYFNQVDVVADLFTAESLSHYARYDVVLVLSYMVAPNNACPPIIESQKCSSSKSKLVLLNPVTMTIAEKQKYAALDVDIFYDYPINQHESELLSDTIHQLLGLSASKDRTNELLTTPSLEVDYAGLARLHDFDQEEMYEEVVPSVLKEVKNSLANFSLLFKEQKLEQQIEQIHQLTNSFFYLPIPSLIDYAKRVELSLKGIRDSGDLDSEEPQYIVKHYLDFCSAAFTKIEKTLHEYSKIHHSAPIIPPSL